MNIKTIIVAGVVIVILYFIMSPYQNCMRDGKTIPAACAKYSLF